MKKLLLLLIAMLVVVSVASALPTTGAATAIGNNNFTFTGNGVAGTVGWFQWGMKEGQSWARSPNVTPAAGVITYRMSGSPIRGCTSFWYRACDVTGCGAEVTLMTLEVTPLPTTTFGQWAEEIRDSHFDPQVLVWNSVQPYVSITGATVFYGIIFAMIFVGLWLRTRGTAVAMQLGMICTVLFASSLVGLQLGLPPEFIAVGQALLYISLAGAIVSFTIK